VSYLNSWQSFKNRCEAAQRKQKIWLSSTTTTTTTTPSAVSDGKSLPGQSLLKSPLNGNRLTPAIESAQQKFQETQVELQKKKLLQLVEKQQKQDAAKAAIDTAFIKSEPASEDEVRLREINVA